VFVYSAACVSLIVFAGLIRKRVDRKTPNLIIRADLSQKKIYLNIRESLRSSATVASRGSTEQAYRILAFVS
jgi:hypothetical protein